MTNSKGNRSLVFMDSLSLRLPASNQLQVLAQSRPLGTILPGFLEKGEDKSLRIQQSKIKKGGNIWLASSTS